MKKFIALFILFFISIVGFTQTNHWFQRSFQYFWQPLPKQSMQFKALTGSTSNWYFRPAVTFTATEFYIQDKAVKVTGLNSVGAGISYEHFINDSNGNLYNNFGVNVLCLVGADWNNITKANLKPAIEVNFLNYVSAGFGWDFGVSKPMFLTGCTIHFQ